VEMELATFWVEKSALVGGYHKRNGILVTVRKFSVSGGGNWVNRMLLGFNALVHLHLESGG